MATAVPRVENKLQEVRIALSRRSAELGKQAEKALVEQQIAQLQEALSGYLKDLSVQSSRVNQLESSGKQQDTLREKLAVLNTCAEQLWAPVCSTITNTTNQMNSLSWKARCLVETVRTLSKDLTTVAKALRSNPKGQKISSALPFVLLSLTAGHTIRLALLNTTHLLSMLATAPLRSTLQSLKQSIPSHVQATATSLFSVTNIGDEHDRSLPADLLAQYMRVQPDLCGYTLCNDRNRKLTNMLAPLRSAHIPGMAPLPSTSSSSLVVLPLQSLSSHFIIDFKTVRMVKQLSESDGIRIFEGRYASEDVTVRVGLSDPGATRIKNELFLLPRIYCGHIEKIVGGSLANGSSPTFIAVRKLPTYTLADWAASEKAVADYKSWENRWQILVQLASSLEYLHNRSVVHGNLNLPNVRVHFRDALVETTLTGFSVSGRSLFNLSPRFGFPPPPEFSSARPWTAECDMWCLGQIMRSISKSTDGVLHPNCPKDFADLIEGLVHPIASNRITAKKVISVLKKKKILVNQLQLEKTIMAKLRVEAESKMKEMDVARQLTERANTLLRRAQNELNTCQSDVDSAQRALDSISGDAAQTSCTEAQADFDRLQAELEAIEAERNTTRKFTKTIRESAKEHKRRLEDLEEEKSEVESQVRTLEREIRRLNREGDSFTNSPLTLRSMGTSSFRLTDRLGDRLSDRPLLRTSSARTPSSSLHRSDRY